MTRKALLHNNISIKKCTPRLITSELFQISRLSPAFNLQPQHEQKLIYSGQLLNDSVILKDILRQYEGQDTHTVHLVCTPPLVTTKMINRPRQMERRNSGEVAANPSNTPASTQPATAAEVTTQPTTNNARVPAAFPHERYPENGFPWTQYAEQTPQMNLNTLNQYQLQMAWMQQAYMQYMTQYMQL